MIKRTSTIPNITAYRKYLNIASLRFNLTLDECRDLFGLYTEEQWINLFSELRYIIKKQELTFYIDWVIQDNSLFLIEELTDGRVKNTLVCSTKEKRIKDLEEIKNFVILTP